MSEFLIAVIMILGLLIIAIVWSYINYLIIMFLTWIYDKYTIFSTKRIIKNIKKMHSGGTKQ